MRVTINIPSVAKPHAASIAGLLSLACLAACTKDTFMEQGGVPLEIVAEVASYNQSNNDLSTRASINSGVKTTFAPGDDLGLFVVDNNNKIIVDNCKFVFQKTGLCYRVDDAGNVIASDVPYNDNYSYFAYAPYNKAYNGCKSVAEITAAYTIAYNQGAYTDQSTQEKYSAADLLVCKAPVLEGTRLRLSFTHAMSLLRIYYNDNYDDLTVDKPVPLGCMFQPAKTESYRYICLPQNGLEVYGTAKSSYTDSDETIPTYSYWQTKVDLTENGSLYVSISAQPTVSYKTAGVDMGLPSGCIWADHNLGAESYADMKKRGGVWYDADGNVISAELDTAMHACFDRGDYFSWGELNTKYEKPAFLFSADTGRISAVGDALVTNTNGTQSVTPFIAGSGKGYYPETYIDRTYSYADIDGNIAGTEYDVVRNKLWKGEWRIPNENEVDELMRNCTITVAAYYYEDNVRYAPWIAEKDREGHYVNLHPDNSEFWGTDRVRPYRYIVPVFKFTSNINGEELYFPGGTWTDWSIDMLATNSRSYHGLKSTTTYSPDYGGMYYFASSASHDKHDCSSYMELETIKRLDDKGKITEVIPVKKTSSYVDGNGNTIYLSGLTQDGHRYTGMLIRPVYGGKNWNTNPDTRSIIHINVEQR